MGLIHTPENSVGEQSFTGTTDHQHDLNLVVGVYKQGYSHIKKMQRVSPVHVTKETPQTTHPMPLLNIKILKYC